NCPPYEAVSYVWGSYAALHRIRLNDRWFWIRDNLYKFLEHAAQGKILIKGLLSNPYRPQYLWIDQICIDQSSGSEKNHQVQAMASIFERAERVVCWLGQSDTDTNLGMDLIAEYVMLRAKHGYDWTRNAKMSENAAQRGIRNIFFRPYWHRLWIAQEFIL
ncbi:heterokaryon incompatibility, partial [Tothia fuscella]